MHMNIDGRDVYVVQFDTVPELPITGLTPEEESGHISGNEVTYAEVLHHAIETEMIRTPGKYAIYIIPGTANYEIFTVEE